MRTFLISAGGGLLVAALLGWRGYVGFVAGLVAIFVITRGWRRAA